jgi:hypothetical protein
VYEGDDMEAVVSRFVGQYGVSAADKEVLRTQLRARVVKTTTLVAGLPLVMPDGTTQVRRSCLLQPTPEPSPFPIAAGSVVVTPGLYGTGGGNSTKPLVVASGGNSTMWALVMSEDTVESFEAKVSEGWIRRPTWEAGVLKEARREPFRTSHES